MGKLREAWEAVDIHVPAAYCGPMDAAITEAEAEIERLKAINAEHCRAIGILTIDGDRLTRERDEARQSVPMPTTVEQAEAMQKVGYAWLAEHAPDRLTDVTKERDDALAKIERMDAALGMMLHAVCGETGFAAAVRADSGHAYPWPALDIAEERARAARKDQP